MTIPKICEWLLVVSVGLVAWLSVVLGYVLQDITSDAKNVIIALPVYLLIAFACYSLGVIGYRVATFNDCIDASQELKQQITEAKEDLKKKGYDFDFKTS